MTTSPVPAGGNRGRKFITRSSRGGLYFAFVVVDGRARQRELKLGITDGLRYEVLSGLQPGDQLIVTGLSAVTDGAPVTIVPLPPGTPLVDQRG